MSGSTFSVTTYPQQFYPGWQETVTLINTGPNSVWIDSDSSVNLITSCRLRPNGTMTWGAGKSLWGMCDDSLNAFNNVFAVSEILTGARLTVMMGVLSTIDNFPISRQIIDDRNLSYAIGAGYDRTFETSSYRSIKIDLRPTIPLAITPFQLIVSSWSDDKQPLGADTYYFTALAAAGAPGQGLIMSQLVPVKGAYTSIQINPISVVPPAHTYAYVRVSGMAYDNPIQMEMQAENNVSAGQVIFNTGGTAFTLARTTKRSVTLSGWTGDAVHLPAAGNRIKYNLNFGAQPGAFAIYFADVFGASFFTSAIIPVGPGTLDGELMVANSTTFSLNGTRTDLTMTVTIHWNE